jgi:hypothetical protein
MDLHRPSPEHFRLSLADDPAAYVELIVETDFSSPQDGLRDFRTQWFRHNQFWRGFSMRLYGEIDGYGVEGARTDVVNLYVMAELSDGQDYILEWTAWPVGSKTGKAKSLKFTWKEATAQQ